MKLLYATALLPLLAFAAPGEAAQPQSGAKHDSRHAGELASLRKSEDPFATVYILTSRKTWDSGVNIIARNPVARRDSVGSDLVIGQIKAYQLSDVSHVVHENEKRCGGYFAFNSQAEAEAFLRSDRAASSLKTTFATYTLDNQATVNPWLPQVSELNIRNTISHLSTAYPNRYYASTTGVTSANWIRDTWLALGNGRSDVSVELFTACGNCGGQPSVILTVQGTDLADEIVVLGGHLDSISNSGSGNSMNAPGADDDASGIATLTEVIRIALANGWKPRRTVKFMGYAAEEVGLRGSNAIAQSFKSQGKNVVGVLQLDMTNYRGGSSLDMRIITDFSNSNLKTFFGTLFDTYLVPLGLKRGTYTCGYGCSDHASWTSAGFPAAMMYEAGEYDFLHTTSDTLATMGNTAAASVALGKFGLAYLGELAKTAGTGNAAPVANFSYAATGLTANFTDLSGDSDGSIASRSWNFGDGGTSTATNPSHVYAAGGSYSVTLTVTDNSGASNSKTQSVAVTDPSGSTVLTNGVAVTNLSASTGNVLNYTLVVPTGATSLKFELAAGTGNADLYVKFGSAPTDTVYDCRPYKATNTETCDIPAPQAGTYYVRVKARKSFSGVRLTGSYVVPGGGGGVQTYSNNASTALPDRRTVNSSILVSGRSGNAAAATEVGVNITHPRRGDLRILLIAPDGTNYLLKAANASDTAANVVETYTINASSEALNGTWKLRVTDQAAGQEGTLNSWTLRF
ncbi:M20/M25/M40 family metallo-hydrolase [Arenimonas sp.]|uniref:M20/M25/M40 family metallo-hydrolase n=1 Tax=Arenimonas sp. TaxID=1872635 RepID=UPI0039E6934E